MKKIICYLLVSSIIFLSTINTAFALCKVDNCNTYDNSIENEIQVNDNGKENIILLKESGSFRKSQVFDERGNLEAEFILDKNRNELYSSITGNTIKLEIEMFSTVGQCEPGNTITSYRSITYYDLLSALGRYFSYASFLAFIAAQTGLVIATAPTFISEGTKLLINTYADYGASYLQKHGIQYKLEGECYYNHRAQMYIYSHSIVDYNTY